METDQTHRTGTAVLISVDLTDAAEQRSSASGWSALQWFRGLFLVAFALLAFRISWMSDDALITLRHVLNITHGWGPGFNATESVQAYTHPLWFLTWVGVGSLVDEWVISIVVVSIVCSTGAVAIVMWQARRVLVALIAGILILSSNAFLEYATSGLENPISYLLVGLVVLLLRRDRNRGQSANGALFSGLAVAGLGLTRLDLLIMIAPMLCLWAWSIRRNFAALMAAGLGFAMPMALWSAWSFATFNSLLPNTYEAKRNLTIPASQLMEQGFRYLQVSITWDPVTLVVIACGGVFVLLNGSTLLRAGVSGAFVYLAYVVWIGGDFMAGRFLAVPFYLVVLMAVMTAGERGFSPRIWSGGESNERQFANGVGILCIAGLVLAGLFTVHRLPVAFENPSDARWKYSDTFGVADERGYYVKRGQGVLDALLDDSLGDGTDISSSPGNGLRSVIEAAGDYPSNSSDVRLSIPDSVGVACGGLGFIGIESGPGAHIVDNCALSDGFLAQIPFVPVPDPANAKSTDPIMKARGAKGWRVGHYSRNLPPGYLTAIWKNDPSFIEDPILRKRLTDLWSAIR
jgi:arabinofuranosyltransferase